MTHMTTKAQAPEVAVFSTLKQAITRRLNELFNSDSPLFITNVSKDDLWDTYLNAFPEGTNPVYKTHREYDCATCRHFIKNLGGLVSVSPSGEVTSLWGGLDLPWPFYPVAAALNTLVATAAIDRPFLTTEAQYGVDKTRTLVTPTTDSKATPSEILTFEHFVAYIPQALLRKKTTIGPERSERRADHDVLLRALREIPLDVIDSVLDLIRQGSIYRGEEKLHDLTALRGVKAAFEALPEELQDRFVWPRALTLPGSVSRIRNTSLGTLLVDLAEGVELDRAVTSYEVKMDAKNYKRPTALVTPKMTAAAREEVARLGLTSALERRYAVLEDVSVVNVLFADRSARRAMKALKNSAASAFDALSAPTSIVPKAFDKVEAVPIAKFLSDVLPHASSIEVLLENRHAGNLVSLIAPVHQDESTARLFKWRNPFSWSYAGEVADAVKERVKAAGGNVTGYFRASLSWFNYDDLDLHLQEPVNSISNRVMGFEEHDGHIYFGQKTSDQGTQGQLDVDMNAGSGRTREAVENIAYPSAQTMREGRYKLWVHQYTKREAKDVGFDVDLEVDGAVHHFHYERAVRDNESIVVAEFEWTRKEGLKIISALPSTTQSKDLWGLKTQAWAWVNVVMLSPNWWDLAVTEEDPESEVPGIFHQGNKHTFFMLDGCANPGEARGFYNEFLRQDLTKHRKVMELVGSKLRVEPAERQLSGLGFSSTKRDVVTLRVTGSAITRVLRVQF